MSFSSSGNRIIQSGTDADLSGLASVSGVTVVSAAGGERGVTVYDLGSNYLVVNGTLDWDPEQEVCITENDRGVEVNGTLNINGEILRDGVATYSENYWLRSTSIFNNTLGGYRDEYAIIDVNTGGTLNWTGGFVAKAGSMVFEEGSSVQIKEGGWNCHQFFNTYPSQVRQFTSDISVDGFKFIDGGSWTDMEEPTGAFFQGFEFNHAYGFGLSGSQYDTSFHTYRDYSAINEKSAGGFWSEVPQDFVNPQNGSDMIVVGFGTDSTNNIGSWQARKEFQLTVESDTVSTDNTKVWIQDNDDGNRQNRTLDTPFTNYVDDRIYLESTTTTSGNISESPIFSVLLASAVRETGGPSGTNDVGLNKKSYRGKNGDESDVFEVRTCGYLTELKQGDYVMKGNGVLEATDKLFADALITEQDEAVVAAYTEIDTAAKLYDAAKLWLRDNYAGEIETLITRNNDTIDLRALDLVVDPTAAEAFTFDGSTITVKATELDANITTSGTVTRQNGGGISGSVVDATGVLFSVIGVDPESLGVDWTVGYISETDYQNRDPNAAPATWTGWNQTTGTGNTVQIQLDADTQYRVFHRAPGYSGTVERQVDTGATFSTTIAPTADRDLQGGLLWDQSSSFATQAAKFTYNSSEQLVEYDNQTGETEYIPFLAAYRGFGDIVFDPALTFGFRFPPQVNATGDGFVINDDSALTLRMSDSSNASAIIEADLAYPDGRKALDRLVSNPNHTFLLYSQTSSVLSSSSIQQVATAVENSEIVAKKEQLDVVNEGIKKASLSIPHSTDI